MKLPKTTTLLLISESTQDFLNAAAAQAHPSETGGILVGVYLGNQPWITAAVEIATNERGRNHYRIPAGATHPAVHRAREADDRLGYLGDWHSHPHDVGPSPTDLASLAFISMTHPRSPNPYIVVVRRTSKGYVLDGRRMVGITPRACRFRLTGNLPNDSVDS